MRVLAKAERNNIWIQEDLPWQLKEDLKLLLKMVAKSKAASYEGMEVLP